MRRNLIPLAAALAVIAVLPATGLAGQLEQAAKGTTPAGLVNRVQRLANALNTFRGRLGNIRRDVNRLKTQVTKLNATDVTQSAAIATLQNTVAAQGKDIATLKTDDATTQGAITSINGQLSAGAAALTAINSALTNSTTGLVGLNNARPLIGFVVSNAAVSGSEFTVTHAGTGQYILSFVNGVGTATDVSKRAVMVQPLPTGGLPVAASSVNCSATGNPCGAGDTKGTDELVVTQTSTTGAPTDANFQAAAISG